MKPTREQIEHRAIELMRKKGAFGCKDCRSGRETASKCLIKGCGNEIVETYLEKAEKELEGRCILTAKQKIQLRRYIDMLGELTHHNYVAIIFDTSPRRHMKFIHKYYCGDEMYDTIAPCQISFADTVFEYGKRYELSDLLEGMGE